MILSSKWYAFLKWFALIALPAFGTAYAVIGGTWGLPYIEQVKTTCLAVGTLIGTLIGVSNANYYRNEGEGNE